MHHVSLSMRVVSVALNPQPTLPAPKAHVPLLPDNLPCFAKRKARHLKKLETIQRRLAWPPRRDDIANTEMVEAFCFRCTVFIASHFPVHASGGAPLLSACATRILAKRCYSETCEPTLLTRPLHYAARRGRCFGIIHHHDMFTRSSRHDSCCFQQLTADAI